MTMQLVSHVIQRDKFYEKYGVLFMIEEAELQDYISDNYSLDSTFDSFVKVRQRELLSSLPRLNEHNTAKLAMTLDNLAMEVAQITAPAFTDMAHLLKDNWTVGAHNLMVHIILGFVWQLNWTKIVCKGSVGSVVLVENPEQCSVIYGKSIALESDKLFMYWQNRLQERNFLLDKVFTNQHVTLMLRSIDDNGFMIPYGNLEMQLGEMGLVKLINVKGSLVLSCKSNVPILDKSQIHLVSDQIREVSKISLNILPEVKSLVLKVKEDVFGRASLVLEQDLLQASYYVWSYSIYKAWLTIGLLPPVIEVPDLFAK